MSFAVQNLQSKKKMVDLVDAEKAPTTKRRRRLVKRGGEDDDDSVDNVVVCIGDADVKKSVASAAVEFAALPEKVLAPKVFTVMVSSDGNWEEHDDACDCAAEVVGMNLGHEHNGSAGGYFTSGIKLTDAQIMSNVILAKAFNSLHKEINLWPRQKVGCFVGICED
jgi:hypothetical protein